MAANSRNPDKVYPTSEKSYPSPLPLQLPDPSLKGISYDQLIQNRGIRFIHKRAAPCPNLRSVDDNSHNPNCTICDGNGIMYYCEKEIWGTFYSNSIEKNFEQQGMWEIGTAVVTLPAYYPDGEVAEFNTYDQLVINDFPVRLWQIKEYDPQENGGVTRVRYPIDTIDLVTSAQNNVRVDFIEGTDFNLDVNGNIVWVAGKAPVYDSVNERGETLSIVYHAMPRYNILQQMRELRVTQELVDGVKVARRLPQQILVKRDFLSNPSNTET